MKWKAVVEDYFTFTRLQRRSILLAILILLGCIATRFVYPYFCSVTVVAADSTFLQEASRLAQPAPDSPHSAGSYHRPALARTTLRQPVARQELFPFDPNTLDAAGWKRLGLRDKTISTIRNYLAKGGRFRQPADLSRIYGLFPDEAERLLPYIRIASAASPPGMAKSTDFSKVPFVPQRPPARAIPVDINQADTSVFISLPGIGSRLAHRIVTFREQLGGFYTVDQIGEVYGLPDSTFQQLKSRLVIHEATTRKLAVNSLSAQELRQNPYIRWNVANAIVQYRQQHGPFKDLEDLQKVALIDEVLWNKIHHYLKVE